MIKDELAAYTANIIKRVGAEQAEVLFRGQIGEAGRVAGKALRVGKSVHGLHCQVQLGPSYHLKSGSLMGPSL